jgi:hypothetical protein
MSANSDLTHRSKKERLFARRRASSLSGIVRPSALAVIAELAKKALDGSRSSISGLDDHRVRRLPRRRSLCLRMYFLEQFGSLRLQVDDERTQSGEVAREDALDALPVRTMTADDEGPAIETVVLAFAADPFTRWGMAASTSVHGRHAEVRPCVRRRRLRAWCAARQPYSITSSARNRIQGISGRRIQSRVRSAT